jgi:hypothetical protein
MLRPVRSLLLSTVLLPACGTTAPADPGAPPAFLPGGRVLLDAHNAYPYEGRFGDRIERALSAGLPIAIEQDLAWCPAGADRTPAPVVSHERHCLGGEPTLETYFFERIAPLMAQALASGPSPDWPIVTLNLDFKSNEPEHHRAVWDLLGRYEHWLTTAPVTADGRPSPLRIGPLLVLTGEDPVQEQTFAGPGVERLRLFGAMPGLPAAAPDAPPRAQPATNYRRWWNHPWRVVEPGGQREAGEWTGDDEERLRAIVEDARRNGLWIRFYTLNGHDGDGQGWFAGYNFGSEEAARLRWEAALRAGVDFVATDQYEAFAAVLRGR